MRGSCVLAERVICCPPNEAFASAPSQNIWGCLLVGLLEHRPTSSLALELARIGRSLTHYSPKWHLRNPECVVGKGGEEKPVARKNTWRPRLEHRWPAAASLRIRSFRVRNYSQEANIRKRHQADAGYNLRWVRKCDTWTPSISFPNMTQLFTGSKHT
jgi:hypothetical protein